MPTPDELATEHLDYALRVAYRAVGSRWWLQDDASSMAMLALDEAIRKRERWRGDFAGFVALVIRRRVAQQARVNRSRFWERSLPLQAGAEGVQDDNPGYALESQENFERLVGYAPLRCRALLRAVYGRGERIDDARKELGYSRSGAMGLLRLARQEIRHALA